MRQRSDADRKSVAKNFLLQAWLADMSGQGITDRPWPLESTLDPKLNGLGFRVFRVQGIGLNPKQEEARFSKEASAAGAAQAASVVSVGHGTAMPVR